MPGPVVAKSDAFKTGISTIDKLMDYLTDDPFGGLSPAPMISIGSPAGRRAMGKFLIERLKEKGFSETGNPVPSELMEVLEFAQQKYPRLFGHIGRVKEVPKELQVSSPEGRFNVKHGQVDHFPGKSRYMELQLNPVPYKNRLGDVEKYGVKFGPDAFDPTLHSFPANLGHELLHVADKLAYPDMMEKYRFSNTLPGGYKANAFEFRAKNAGESFMKKFEDWKKAQAGTHTEVMKGFGF